ncbi:MAG: MBL fold metallo-hydrolase [Saprospiraceae bacterium]
MIKSIHSIETGKFKLDGGAMFGVVPKSMWNKLNPSDENNMCTWALRCLLIITEDRNILVDTGMGNKQDEKFRSHFSPHEEISFSNSLGQHGLGVEDITDVFLTHLHFDHCGGAISYNENKELVPTFPKARYWSNKSHWSWAFNPNEREKNSFLKENFVPLEQWNILNFIVEVFDSVEFIPGIKIHFFSGHTKSMMGLEMDCQGQKYFYTADLFPSSYHLPIPYVMAYDVNPLVSLIEKKKLLDLAFQNQAIIIFEHDPTHIACTLKRNDHGKIVIDEYINL